MDSYEDIYQRSLRDPEAFWGEAASALHWDRPWDSVLDSTRPPFYRWFSGAEINTCYNCLDRHVQAGNAERPALIYDSPVTDTVETFTYQGLLDRVAVFAGALSRLGVSRGDTVVIYMPMIPEAVISMLACARLGAIHSVVFGGFAPAELALRIDDARPKVVISASGAIEGKRVIEYKPLLDAAIDMASHKPGKTVILQRSIVRASLEPGRDIDWVEAVDGVDPAPCTPVAATDPLYILYTSGTTGKPKGVMRDNGGHAVALNWSMKNIYGAGAGDVFWAASDVGWVVGHSYIVYGPLLAGCTTVLYEGKSVGTPDPGAFWRVISQHGVKVLFTAPTAFRAIKKEDPRGEYLKKYDLATLSHLFLAGERLDSDTYHWASGLLNVPVVDHWWQTETGWPIAANCVGIAELPLKPGSPTKAVPGFDVRVVDDNGAEVARTEEGMLVVRLPLPPGTLPSLWNNDARFVESYMNRYEGYYQTSDEGFIDEDGYIFVMGRADDVINVAGHRLSTGSMEEVVATHSDVAECAVFGAGDQLKGQLPVGLVVLKAGVERSHAEIKQDLVAMVRRQIGPIACFREMAIVNRLPKTRSGKILRGTIRLMADGKSYPVPSTIDDPAILGEIEAELKKIGYAQ